MAAKEAAEAGRANYKNGDYKAAALCFTEALEDIDADKLGEKGASTSARSVGSSSESAVRFRFFGLHSPRYAVRMASATTRRSQSNGT